MLVIFLKFASIFKYEVDQGIKHVFFFIKHKVICSHSIYFVFCNVINLTFMKEDWNVFPFITDRVLSSVDRHILIYCSVVFCDVCTETALMLEWNWICPLMNETRMLKCLLRLWHQKHANAQTISRAKIAKYSKFETKDIMRIYIHIQVLFAILL